MDTRLIAAAIPLFALAMAFEWWVARRKNLEVYRLFDAIADLSCGVSQQAFLLLTQAPLLVAYAWIQGRAGLIEWDHSVLTFAIAWIAIDFLYYWWHRASHRINWMWGLHIVHHHSEDYNLAVALRQAMFTHASAMIFYLPMALLGFDVLVFGVVMALNTLIQFWIHTETIRKVPPLEPIFNTPSHHRVHHGVNDQYLDKNYAGFLIIWDRIFGTFEPEVDEVVYGITKPLNSFNPFWANLHYFVELWQRMGRLDRIGQKLWLWWAPPEWLGDGETKAEPAPQRRADQTKYEVEASKGFRAYVMAGFVAVIGLTLWLILVGPTLPVWTRWCVVAFLYLLLWSFTWGARPLRAAKH